MARTGRPTKINEVVGERPVLDADGAPTDVMEPVTVADRICEHLERHAYREQAAIATGISKDTFYDWLRTATLAGAKLHRGERLNAHERRCLDFSDAVERAEALSEQRSLERLDALANGTDAAVALRAETFRLSRRHRKRWGDNVTVELGDDTAEAMGELAASARTALGDLLTEVADRLAPVQIVGAGHVVDEGDTPLLEATEERPGAQAEEPATPTPSGG